MINLFPFKSDSQKKKDLVRDLHNSMCAHFLEHTMYDINDALTSILALCDIEEMKTVPKVKKYIQKVNELMDNVQIYQNSSHFNVNHVLSNVINIIKDSFKRRVDIKMNAIKVNALVQSKQAALEQVLIFIFIELISNEKDGSAALIDVDLKQKGQDVIIVIQKENYSFSANTLKEIDLMKVDLNGSFSISPKGNGVVVRIQMPLIFSKGQDSNVDVCIIPKKTGKPNKVLSGAQERT